MTLDFTLNIWNRLLLCRLLLLLYKIKLLVSRKIIPTMDFSNFTIERKITLISLLDYTKMKYK